jgi:hypothetical protein
MENEKWEVIPGFNRYQVSESGKLRSLKYKRKGIRELKPALTIDGYLKTMLLGDDGKYHTNSVHYWVSLTFLGKRPDGTEVNHINGIKTDNSYKNLEYITHSQNCQHAVDNGLWIVKHGSLSHNAKITEADVRFIRNYVKEYQSTKGRYYGRKELAVRFGISESHLKDIVTQRRGVWKYA